MAVDVLMKSMFRGEEIWSGFEWVCTRSWRHRVVRFQSMLCSWRRKKLCISVPIPNWCIGKRSLIVYSQCNMMLNCETSGFLWHLGSSNVKIAQSYIDNEVEIETSSSTGMEMISGPSLVFCGGRWRANGRYRYLGTFTWYASIRGWNSMARFSSLNLLTSTTLQHGTYYLRICELNKDVHPETLNINIPLWFATIVLTALRIRKLLRAPGRGLCLHYDWTRPTCGNINQMDYEVWDTSWKTIANLHHYLSWRRSQCWIIEHWPASNHTSSLHRRLCHSWHPPFDKPTCYYHHAWWTFAGLRIQNTSPIRILFLYELQIEVLATNAGLSS